MWVYVLTQAWNGKPLPCVPLTVGHQCVGGARLVLTRVCNPGWWQLFRTQSRRLTLLSLRRRMQRSGPVRLRSPNCMRRGWDTHPVRGSRATFFRGGQVASEGEIVHVCSDIEYGKCFRAYMSLQCASAFPACTVLQADETNVLGRGRAPLCFSHCLDTLVSCPGFWVDDLDGACLDVAAEPSCSRLVLWLGPWDCRQWWPAHPTNAQRVCCPFAQRGAVRSVPAKQYATLDETLAANVA